MPGYVMPLCLGISIAGLCLVLVRLMAVQNRCTKLLTENEFSQKQIETLQQEKKGLLSENKVLEESLSLERQHLAGLRSQMESLEQKITEKKQEWEDLQELLKGSFAGMSQKWVDEAGEKLLKSAEEKWKSSNAELDLWFQNKNQSLQEFLMPIKTSLSQVENSLKSFDQARVANFSKMDEQLQGLMNAYRHLSSETSRLSQALKSTGIRGQWGEIQLKRVVELGGLVEYCDFVTQSQVSGESSKLRPDMVIRLPKDRVIIVDAKAPLNSFLKAMECEDETEKRQLLKNHAREIRNHVQALSSKEYWNSFNDSLEFVVMFLPGENILGLAYMVDPELFETGIKNRVIIATPMTLIALLKAVAYGWNQEKANDNTEKIAALGYELHERLIVFSRYFQDMEKSFLTMIKSYNQMVASFESRVLVSARKFKNLGAAGEKEYVPPAEIDQTVASVKPQA